MAKSNSTSKAMRRLKVMRSSPSSPKRKRSARSTEAASLKRKASEMAGSDQEHHESNDVALDETSAAKLLSSAQSSRSKAVSQVESGLLGGKNPSDVSAKELQKIVQEARDANDLWGSISMTEKIEKTFQWFGADPVDLPWYFKKGNMMERSIVSSPHNRELQVWQKHVAEMCFVVGVYVVQLKNLSFQIDKSS